METPQENPTAIQNLLFSDQCQLPPDQSAYNSKIPGSIFSKPFHKMCKDSNEVSPEPSEGWKDLRASYSLSLHTMCSIPLTSLMTFAQPAQCTSVFLVLKSSKPDTTVKMSSHNCRQEKDYFPGPADWPSANTSKVAVVSLLQGCAAGSCSICSPEPLDTFLLSCFPPSQPPVYSIT